MSERPLRIQRKRVKGWRMPENTVYVGRIRGGERGHGKWGNPLRIGMYKGYTAADAVEDYRRWLNREPGVRSYENVYGKPPTCQEIVAELRGKNLACFCALGTPCHAEVLLELANA